MDNMSIDLRAVIRRAWEEAERRGWDKTEFAVRRMRLQSSQVLTNWLGSRGMPGAELKRVAAALGWTVDQLIDGKPSERPAVVVMKESHPVMEWYETLPKYHQAVIDAAARAALAADVRARGLPALRDRKAPAADELNPADKVGGDGLGTKRRRAGIR